jgi:2',3'-cyclic-nucleotide 2'-phosphodiesterase (5'-nucleotidase family)
MSDLVILHTNDLHGRLTEEKAERLRTLKAAAGRCTLLLDAGDAVSSGNVTFHLGGEAALATMSDAGYDAMVVGNREFHFTQAGFAAKTSLARFPVLCANVRARSDAVDLPVRPSVLRTMPSGLRVGLFGLTVPMITERMLVRKVSAYVFDNPLDVAARLVPLLRGDCDLLVCLSHLGIAQDRRLAAAVPEIDLIVGGHTHATLERGETESGTLIVQAAAHAKLVGRVEVELKEGGTIFTANLMPL